MIGYKSNVKELFFIRQGIVEVFNNPRDEEEDKKDKTLLYLPKYSYFGDYQILFSLKSNLIFKTLSKANAKSKSNHHAIDEMEDFVFMCVKRDCLFELCDLFPQTAENIRRRAMERRSRFMKVKNNNSRKYTEK